VIAICLRSTLLKAGHDCNASVCLQCHAQVRSVCICAGYLPVVLAGPLLGAAVVYDMEVGHWLAAPRRFTGKPPGPPALASQSLPR